ncbi:peptidylprolyl isomerase [Planotetraspora kaengkrachanensis]|uniref:Peptidyl-prolyl cis-trans isomerase n=1 Tax=Planotetraspora kaengkrachanensis TaxID=575193 RepID=A0A8J3Q049_9ACTN|nr:peptidylprolyl isomerase [Planotetraspora kaengkrachanensis]GIG84157.1 peptidylprolyl isomerase [Planotetraspora kaengkrachanensis]
MVTGKDRQRQLAREHYQRQMQTRVERQQRARRVAILGTSTAVVVVIGGIVAAIALLGGTDGDVATASAAPTASAPATDAAAAAEPKAYDPATGTCGYVADPGSGQIKDVGLPPAKVSTAAATMTIKTNLGDIVAKLDAAKAPCTVGSFRYLASKNYFKDTKCHRLGTDFPILQCGDPLAKADGKNPTDGQGGPGYRFVDENLEGAKYTRGVLAMANSGPNTNGSQFFIVFGDTGLNAAYTPFGTVTKGLEILDKVAKQGILPGGTGDGTGAPKQPVEIKDVTITGKS